MSVVPFRAEQFGRRSVPPAMPAYASLDGFVTPADVRVRHHAQPVIEQDLMLPDDMRVAPEPMPRGFSRRGKLFCIAMALNAVLWVAIILTIRHFAALVQ